MAHNMNSFVSRLGNNLRTGVSQFHICWQEIRARDNNYQSPVTNSDYDDVQNSLVDVEADVLETGEVVVSVASYTKFWLPIITSDRNGRKFICDSIINF